MSPKVIVVGGGPSGASTAFSLAQAGVEVEILDRARFPRDKPCGEYLSPEASRILAAMGALAPVENAGSSQLSGMAVRSPDGTCVRGYFAGSHGFDGFRTTGIAVRRTVLDPILLSRARVAGAEVIEGTHVSGVLHDRSGAVCGVRTMESDGIARDRRADFVVGADGLRSVIARRLGLARRARWPRRIALVTHYTGVRNVGAVGEMHVDRHGYFGLVDVGRGLTNTAVVVPASHSAAISAGATEFLEKWIAERPHLRARYDGAERVQTVRATGPFAVSVTRAWAPGAALVGDAAEFYDPFTGEGIYTALRGGELLAPYVLDAVRKTRTGAKATAALRAYEGARRAEFGGKWKVERLVSSFISFPLLINRAARTLAARQEMADLLVGVVGDFVPPREVLKASFVLRLLRGPAAPFRKTRSRARSDTAESGAS